MGSATSQPLVTESWRWHFLARRPTFETLRRSFLAPITTESHLLLGLGYAAVYAGHSVCYFAAADLVETLYRGLADNSVGRVIDNLLRADLVLLDEFGFAPL